VRALAFKYGGRCCNLLQHDGWMAMAGWIWLDGWLRAQGGYHGHEDDWLS
jgi:hypothetical protein